MPEIVTTVAEIVTPTVTSTMAQSVAPTGNFLFSTRELFDINLKEENKLKC